jgi:aminoglycoside 6'-N-acetyltransferase I
MRIAPLKRDQLADWQRLRAQLWPEVPGETHRREMVDLLSDLEFNAVFVAIGRDRKLHGFIEVSIRLQAEGCGPGPIGYVEGWFVEERHRRRGVGSALMSRAEAWAAAHGCKQMASDAEVGNQIGRQAHQDLGYQEVACLAHFRKSLSRTPAVGRRAGSAADERGRGS